jgi:YVTN family beta-propeller protein
MCGMSPSFCRASLGFVFLAALLAGCTSKPGTEERGAAAGTASESPLPAGPRLFVTDEVGGVITVIDVNSAKSIATIPVGKRPRGLTLSPDKTTIYVTLSGSPIGGPGIDEDKLPKADKKADGIGVVSVKELRLLRVIHGGSDPENVAVSADGSRIFATNEDTGQASALDPADGRLLASAKVGGEPEGVNVRPDGKVLYVTSEQDNKVTVLDTMTMKTLATIAVGPRPRSTAFLPDNSRAYVPAENGSSISVIDAQKHRLLQTIKLAGGRMVKPMGTAVAPDGTRLFVTTGRGQMLVIIDTKTNQPIAEVEAGERPWGIAVSPDGKTVFTANGPSHDVSFIDVDSRSVKTRVKAGERPWGIVYVP